MGRGGVIWDEARPVPVDFQGPTDRPFAPIDEGWTSRSLLERFDAICERFPDRIAVDDGVDRLTYVELRARAYALSHKLKAIAPADRPAAAIIPGTVVYAIALMAALAAGVPLTPVDVTHPLARKQAMLEETKPGLLLLLDGLEYEPGLLPEGTPRLDLSLVEPALETAAPDFPDQARLAGVAFTSGSTGRPKGLAYDQRGTYAFVAEFVNSLHVNEEDVILSLASLGAGGNLGILAAVLTGARVRMLEIRAAGIDGVLDCIEAERATLLSMIPLVFRALFQSPAAKAKLVSLRAIISGGDRLLGSDLDLFRSVLPKDCLIRQTQGSTETAVAFFWFVPPDFHIEPQATVPSGYLAPGKSVGLVAAQSLGEFDGEFLVRGRDLAAGGWQGGRLTPGPFTADADDPSLKVYDTGDVARRGADGLYTFVGRRDRQIKILGLRADPADVEAILRTAHGVGDVVVIPRRTGDEAVFVAYVVALDPHHLPSADALQAAVAEAAPPHMVPAELRFLPAIPRLPNYKPDFVALEALDKANRPAPVRIAQGVPAPVDPNVAEAVRKAWISTLSEESFTTDRPWNRTGGDSLKALQFMLRLEEWLGRKLPLELFDPTLPPSGFAARIAAHLASTDADGDQDRPLVFLCPGIAGDDTRLAALRRALSTRLNIKLIEYPELDRPLAELRDPERLIRDALTQIEAQAPTGPVRLAGYSIGGLVAFDVAARLAKQGRSVERVCVIDADASERAVSDRWLPVATNPAKEWAWIRSNAKAHGWKAALQEIPISFMLRHELYGLLRQTILFRNKKPGHRSVYARKLLLERLRGRAFMTWKPQSYSGEIWLVRAQEKRNAGSDDLGWTPYVGSLRIVEVPGDHRTILDEPNIGALCAALAVVLGDEPLPAAAE